MGKKRDLRRTHSGQAVSGRQGEPVVVVRVSRDFVPAVGVLGVGQERVLEPGHEFALKKKPPQVVSHRHRTYIWEITTENNHGRRNGGKRTNLLVTVQTAHLRENDITDTVLASERSVLLHLSGYHVLVLLQRVA